MNNYCWRYDPVNDDWIREGEPTASHTDSAADYNAAFGLVMANGDPGNSNLVETTNDGVQFGELPSLPLDYIGFNYACLVAVDDDRLFFAGGDTSASERAFMYSRSTGEWTDLARMTFGRFRHSCGLVETSERGLEIVVAGAYPYDDGSVTPICCPN